MAESVCDRTENLSLNDLNKGCRNYYELNVIKDHKTEMYMKFAKVMIIYQGPYSDERKKTHDALSKKFKYTLRLLSDYSYAKEMNTRCSYEKTEEFYQYVKHETQKALEEGHNLILIDSSMSNISQNRFFFALAQKFQYAVLIVPPLVSEDKLYWPKQTQAGSFREVEQNIVSTNNFKHLFCGYFLHDVDSYDLRHLASYYVQDCFEDVREFAELFQRHEINTVEDFKRYFNMEDRKLDPAFCAVKVFEGMLHQIEYFKKSEVHAAYGKVDKLLIVGFIISPHMIAARVKLSHHQKELWEREDYANDESQLDFFPSELREKSKNNFPDVFVQLISSKSNTTLAESKTITHEPLASIHHLAKGRSCHIVLGKANKAPSKSIDYDVAFALNMERLYHKNNKEADIDDLRNCMVKRVGKYWFIYMKKHYTVNAIFASCSEPCDYAEPLAIQMRKARTS